MQYKTIVLELLQARPQMHEQLRKERKLTPDIEKQLNAAIADFQPQFKPAG